MNKRPKVTEKTQQAFIDAFCSLYKKMPVEKITVQELTRMTGYNRSTFYQYFRDIYDLLDYLEENVINFIIQERGEGLSPNLEHPEWWLKKIAYIFEEKKQYLTVLLGDFGNNRFTDRLKAEIPSPFPLQEPYDKESAEIYFIRETLFSAAVSGFRSWTQYENYLTSDEMVTLLYNLFLPSIQSQSGEKIFSYLSNYQENSSVN